MQVRDPDFNHGKQGRKSVQQDVVLDPTPTGGLAGATVTWRCTRRACQALRVTEYKFKKPARNHGPNAWSPADLLQGGPSLLATKRV